MSQRRQSIDEHKSGTAHCFIAARNDSGFALVWTVLMLTVLMGVGGVGVDVGHWYITIERLQKEADSAALAGTVYLPANPIAAKQAAIDNLAMNGVADPGQVVEIVQVPGKPSLLRIHLHTTIDNIFIRLLGSELNKQSFDRTSVAQFRGAMPMGSPSNVPGQEPVGLPLWNNLLGTQRDYWLQADGGIESKIDGDRWMSDCSQVAGNNVYGCAGKVNLDYRPAGQQYIVRIPATTTGNVAIQAFDAPDVNIGWDCTQNNIGGAVGLQSPGDPADIYQPGVSSPYCSGDNNAVTGPTTSTTYSLSTPKSSIGGSVPIAGCTTNFPGYSGDIPTLLKSTPPGLATTAAAFRHWYTLCTIPVGPGFVPGDYILNVTTDVSKGGVNLFSLRAAAVNSDGSENATETAGINVFADGRLTVFAGFVGANTQFYLAQVPSSQAGQTFEADLFDVGDAKEAATLQIIPPPDGLDGSTPLSSFSGCVAYGPEPKSAASSTSANCAISNLTYDGYNGQLLRVVVPIPANYQCNDTDPLGCWVRIKLSYPSGTPVSDVTSWEVKMSGGPVRLVQNQ